MQGDDFVGLRNSVPGALVIYKLNDWKTSCGDGLSVVVQVFAALRSSQLHIPYRNSKLTHILQPSLGGDAKVGFVIC